MERGGTGTLQPIEKWRSAPDKEEGRLELFETEHDLGSTYSRTVLVHRNVFVRGYHRLVTRGKTVELRVGSISQLINNRSVPFAN